MTIAYTSEGIFPLLDTGASNWGTVINGVFTSLDAGYTMTYIAEEVIVKYETVYISSSGKVSKADADVITKRPCIGIALAAAGVGATVKVQKIGWMDYNDTALGGALGATAGNKIYLSATAGRLSITPTTTYPQVIGIAKTTTAANITRIFIIPELNPMPTALDGTTGMVTLTGKLVVDLDNSVVGGADCIYADAIQITNALTGTLRAGYFVATNGNFASSGTIRGLEVIARAATSGLVGGNVGTLEGMSLSADAKNKTVTLLRGAEIILDGQSGAAVTTAVGLRISNNFQAALATTSYGLQIYRDSFDYTADIQLSSGGTVGGLSGNLKIDSSGVLRLGGVGQTVKITRRTDLSFPVSIFTADIVDKNFAYDFCPNGSPGDQSVNTGVCWVDICSTDLVTDTVNYECLRIGKFNNGPGQVSCDAGGSGTIRDLVLQWRGGKVSVGQSKTPNTLLDVYNTAAGTATFYGATDNTWTNNDRKRLLQSYAGTTAICALDNVYHDNGPADWRFTTFSAGAQQTDVVTITGTGQLFVAQVTGTYKFGVNGTSALGDGGTTNYVQFAADGEINLFGTARITKEFEIVSNSFSPGSSGASIVLVGNYPGWSFGIGDDIVSSFEVPHDWDESTLFTVYIYWHINEAYATHNGEVQWRARWSATPPSDTETIDAPTHTGTIDFGDQNIPATAKRLTKSTAGTIAAASLANGDLIGINFDRVALDGGSDPTAEPIIDHVEIHYISNKLGIAT